MLTPLLGESWDWHQRSRFRSECLINFRLGFVPSGIQDTLPWAYKFTFLPGISSYHFYFRNWKTWVHFTNSLRLFLVSGHRLIPSITVWLSAHSATTLLLGKLSGGHWTVLYVFYNAICCWGKLLLSWLNLVKTIPEGKSLSPENCMFAYTSRLCDVFKWLQCGLHH